jgi:hypothetical protein
VTTQLRAFLYILLRDYLTLGQVEAALRDSDKAARQGASFSNTHLRDYLDEIVSRLERADAEQ